MKEFRNEIEYLLEKNEFKLAFERIQVVIENNDRLKRDLVILKSKLNEVNEREMHGTLDYDSARREKNKVIQGLIDLTREIAEEEYVSFIEKSEIVLKLRENIKEFQDELNATKGNFQKLQDELIKQKSEIVDLKVKLKESIAINKFLSSELNNLVAKIFIDECKKCEGKEKIQLKYRDDDESQLLSLYNSLGNLFVSDKNKHKGFTFFYMDCPYCKNREINEENKPPLSA